MILNSTGTSQTLPTFFIPHGGGPCFFMDWTNGPADTWNALGDFLKHLAESLPVKPRAIVIVSGHWEQSDFTVNAGERPPLLYDYNGFPEHTYHLQYPASGDPELAKRIQSLLGAAGFPVASDDQRGLDHGVFIPFKLVYPDADIPIVQLSLKKGLDARVHIAVGQALAPLRDEGVLIVGSGMSYHNLRAFGPEGREASDLFDAWLSEALQAAGTKRDDALAHWSEAPAARTAHPREEHLIPLMVAAGAAHDEPGQKIFEGRVPHVKVSAFRFG